MNHTSLEPKNARTYGKAFTGDSCEEKENGCFLLNEVGDLINFWYNFILLLLLFVLWKYFYKIT